MAKRREEAWSLSDDLIVEILIRLPVKSLLRFRLVCKFWYNLIKSPNFIQLHLKHSSTRNNRILIKSQINIRKGRNPILTLHSYESLDLITKLDMQMEIPKFYYGSVNICGICNGLICLSDSKSDYILVWNPAIRQLKKVLFGYFSIFHCMAIGIGFDSITNDYKVVAFVLYPEESSDEGSSDDESGQQLTGSVYNISTNSSKSFREFNLDNNLAYVRYNRVHVPPINGALHWIAERYVDGADSEKHLSILSFDMSSEDVEYIEFPDDPLVKLVTSEKLRYLTVSNESLALFVFSRGCYEMQFIDIWVMQEYGVAKSWTKLVSIGPLTKIEHPLMLWKNKSILLETSKGRLVSCALDTSEIIDPQIDRTGEIFKFMIYHESLVSVVSRSTK